MKKLLFLFAFALWFAPASAQRPGENTLRSAQGNFNQYLTRETVKNLDANAPKKAGMIHSFNNMENTVGRRFLFDTWVKGDSVAGMQGNFINSVAFLFNFDKLTGNLLVTQDKINIMSVIPGGISSFILEDMGQQYVFEHANAIDSLKFFQALVKGDKPYSLYKLHASTFIPANSRNDGIVKTGNTYDEYKDATAYYIVDNKAHSGSLVSLKPKGIKSVLKGASEKVDTYFRTHKADSINENFLIGLVTFLNQ